MKLNETQVDIVESYWDLRCSKFLSKVLDKSESSNRTFDREDLTKIASESIVGMLTKDRDDYDRHIDYYYSSIPVWQQSFKNLYNLVNAADGISDDHPVISALNDGRIGDKQQLHELKEEVGKVNKSCLAKFIQENMHVKLHGRDSEGRDDIMSNPYIGDSLSCSPSYVDRMTNIPQKSR